MRWLTMMLLASPIAWGIAITLGIAVADSPRASSAESHWDVQGLLQQRSFLKQHCYDCHGDGASEGSLAIDSLLANAIDVPSIKIWERIFDRVADGEMPPSDAPQPDASELNDFSQQLGRALADQHREQKGTVLRRLNRREYENTLNDLFGTRLALANMLPEDGRSHEFDNVGESLELSLVQLERYLQAIERVLETTITKTDSPPKPKSVRATYAAMRGAEKFIGSQWGQLKDGAIVFYRAPGYPTGMLREAQAKIAGRYRIQIAGYAHQSERPITFELATATFARGVEEPILDYFSMPPGSPEKGSPHVIQTEAWLEAGYMLKITPQGIADPTYHIKNHGVDSYPGPGLAISHVELEGPLGDEQVAPLQSWATSSKDASELLSHACGLAFRRTVNESDVLPFQVLHDAELERGESSREAMKTALAAVFCSPEFLFLNEPAGELDDHALAARLAYFLTRTAPDKPLRDLAVGGRLGGHPDELARQVDRLMTDSRSERFVVDFTDAWLNLRDILFTSPDRQLFPEYDAYLQWSMLAETRGYFRYLIEQNRPVTELVKSDFAILNERLASHYEIDSVTGPELRPVKIAADSPRGGLLGQASVLKVSANGTNTSPVVRGVYVTERILGRVAPPPPPGVPGVEPDTRGATTLRELLAKHRDNDDCRACHAMIDPPGFALESFNPIGAWRERFRSLGDGDRVNLVIGESKARYRLGPAVDASGEFADGHPFSGYHEFREMLAAQPEVLCRTLVTKWLTFATGREMGFSDRAEIEQIVRDSSHENFAMRGLLQRVVASQIFRTK